MRPPPSVRKPSLILSAALLILALSGLSYLILAGRQGFTNDDWYLVYAGLVGGSAKFSQVFAIDRPFRAPLVGLVFDLFGLNAPAYAYFSYLLRISAAFGLFWLARLCWPRQGRLAVVLAALFAIYPGWMDQPTAFDYQSHLLSFALMVFSLALTARAWLAPRPAAKAGLTTLGVAFQLLSLFQMEYYLGLEGLRLALLVYLAGRANLRGLFRRGGGAKLRAAALHGLPYLAGAGAFFIWRVFFFSSGRAATDVGGMFTALLGSPVYRGLNVLAYVAQDFVNVTFGAWFVPLYQTLLGLRLRDALVALALGGIAAAAAWAAWRWLLPQDADEATAEPDGAAMLWLGALGVIFSLLPIALGDRRVIFPQFSRFTLPGSIGTLLMLGGLLLALRRERARLVVVMLLAGLAVTANYGNATKAATAWSSIRNFWWQMSWRAPQIQPETVLAAQYNDAAVIEDYFVWGPANLVYYPEPYQPDGVTRTPLSAVVLTRDNILNIQMGSALNERVRRGITSGLDLSQLLVLSMPDAGSCLHVLDGLAPEHSHKEDQRILLVAQSSDLGRIDTTAAPRTPPAALFGAEPEHTWCHYYQSASLARQRGDWHEVARLGDEAIAAGLHPVDWVEWFPFIQAYAYLGQTEAANRIYPILADVPYLKHQGCQIFSADARGYGKQFPQGQAYLREKFCQ